MRYPPHLQTELEDFIRWLAIMPQHFKSYRAFPEPVMRTARLSPAAIDWLEEAGLERVIVLVKAKFDEICEHPDSWQRTEFTRDRSVGGYGGAVIKGPKG